MKSKYVAKIRRYIQENDLPKLKHMKRKHDFDLTQVLLEGSNSLLHLACDFGHDSIVRYLLKIGCDCLLVNEDGDLPIHKACAFARETDNAYVFQDLLEPLIQACPESVHVGNRRGVTPKQHIVYIRARANEQKEDSSISDVEFDSQKQEEEDFNRRLQEEMTDECYDQWSHYQQYDRDQNSEASTAGNCDDWMNKISEERKRKHRSSYAAPKKRKNKKKDDNTEDDKPKISDNQRKKFEEKMKEIYRKENAAKFDKSKEEKARLKQLYESNCKDVFSSSHKDGIHKQEENLGYRDIPWPYEKGKDVNTMEEFLFSDLTKGSAQYKKYLREQQIRWHPDRFLQKCGERLKSRHKDKIVDKVKEISQLLNSMSDAG